MPDQLAFWNEWHQRRGATGDDPGHRATRKIFLDSLPSASRCAVIDLGCGQGHDLAAFARAGHDAYGLDYSEEAVRQSRNSLRGQGVADADDRVCVRDVTAPLSYPAGRFDGAFSHLSITVSTRRRRGDLEDSLAGWQIARIEPYSGHYASAEPSHFLRVVAHKRNWTRPRSVRRTLRGVRRRRAVRSVDFGEIDECADRAIELLRLTYRGGDGTGGWYHRLDAERPGPSATAAGGRSSANPHACG
ncbi:class I SAM-dependent methyltransferase [Cryptosporangium sp. NPDC051539]|uniref:class I SAM-dependent methyltransferase n=1 Tax=Cryptosporangium sp. NPDC051539 TaxID=3363962 RepID=UPI0037988CF1